LDAERRLVNPEVLFARRLYLIVVFSVAWMVTVVCRSTDLGGICRHVRGAAARSTW
jgi:hypothetical protein